MPCRCKGKGPTTPYSSAVTGLSDKLPRRLLWTIASACQLPIDFFACVAIYLWFPQGLYLTLPVAAGVEIPVLHQSIGRSIVRRLL